MNTEYLADTRFQKSESIGALIRDWRCNQKMKLEEIAEKVCLALENGQRLSFTTLIRCLMGIEQGNFYGLPSLLARKGKRGEQNLKRTALYLSVLGIPQEHQIIEQMSELDPRFRSLYDLLDPRVDTPRSCLGEDSSVGLGSCPRVNTLYRNH